VDRFCGKALPLPKYFSVFYIWGDVESAKPGSEYEDTFNWEAILDKKEEMYPGG